MSASHQVESPIAEKRARCLALIGSARRAIVAYSGGIDSTLVARLAHETLGSNALAATAVSPSLARSDLEEACSILKVFGMAHRLIESNEMEKPEYRRNAPDRCYFCKATAYDLFSELAAREGFECVFDGTNADDVADHRPGRRAARERGVRSPLQEAGLTKAEIREWAAELGLPNQDKPANACLSSRVPFGMEVTPAKLAQIEAAEASLRALGFTGYRVRHHGQIARIEVPPETFPLVLANAAAITAALKSAGFLYVTLDIEGFRSGSLNEALGAGR